MTKMLAALTLLLLASQTCPGATFSLNPEQLNVNGTFNHTFHFTDDNSTASPQLNIYLFPKSFYGLKEYSEGRIFMDYRLISDRPVAGTFYLSDTSVANFTSQTNFTFYPKESPKNLESANESNSFAFNMSFHGLFLGRTSLQLNLTLKNSTSGRYEPRDSNLYYEISVIRTVRAIDVIFRVIIWVFILFANTGMGMELDMEVIKKVLKKPVAPVVGFFAQFGFMPMISFVVLLFLPLPASTALGYFGMGCAPGGGASNFYCLLLGGDVSLSITMTLVSTVGALGMVPLYMFTLGQYILDEKNINIQIPYVNIIITLLLILIPSVIGYVCKLYLPKFSAVYRKILKPMVLVFIIFMFTFGIYANLFIWRLFSPIVIIAGCILPYVGFLAGALLAFIFRQPWTRIKTIAIETGIQNPGVPILILQTSLPQPDADLSMVGPVAAATFTPLPLMIWVLTRIIITKCKERKKAEKEAAMNMDMMVEDDLLANVVEEEEKKIQG